VGEAWEVTVDDEPEVTNDIFTAEVIDNDGIGPSVVVKFASGINVVVRGAMATPGNVVIETYGKVAAVKAAGNTKQTPNLGNRVTSYEVHRDKS
jgi:hypothetical protein